MDYKQTIKVGRVSSKQIGRGQSDHKSYPVEIQVKLDNDRLSICGDIWLPSRNDIVSGGQNLEEIAKLFPNNAKVREIVKVWRRWHLNDMKAGCEHQRAEGWDKRPIDPSKPTDSYGRHFEGQKSDSWNLLGWIRPDEHPEGLLTKPCPICGYRYGTAWLKEDLPQEVIDKVLSW